VLHLTQHILKAQWGSTVTLAWSQWVVKAAGWTGSGTVISMSKSLIIIGNQTLHCAMNSTLV